MQTIVLSPNTQLFSRESLDLLNSKYGAIFFEKASGALSELLSNSDEKILMIDPDFFSFSLPREELEKWQNVSAVLLQTTSYDWVDYEFLSSHDVPVCSIPNYSTNAVSESVCASMISLARKYATAFNGADDPYPTSVLHDVDGKTIGIIGLGAIGSAVGEKASRLGLKVCYWSKNSRNNDFAFKDLDEIFSTSHFVVPALKSNDETKTLITDELLLSMRPDSSFVSVIPKIFNHNLLIERVESGKLWGYSYEYENSEKKPIHSGNVLAVPSNAFATDNSAAKNTEIWLLNLENAYHDKFPNKVN